MKPRAIGAKKELVRSGAPGGLHKIIEPSDARGVGKDIRPADQLIYYLLLRAPVVIEAAEMRTWGWRGGDFRKRSRRHER